MPPQDGVRSTKCRRDPCEESALSFSKYCWSHIEQGPYLLALREAIGRAERNAPLALNLKKVECDGLDFSGFDLKGSSFCQAKISRCGFIGADLSGVNLIGASFTRCDFVGADLSKANLTRTVFAHSSFSYADFQNACLIEAVFRDTDFMGTVMWDVILWNADISGAVHLKKKNFCHPANLRNPRQARLSENDALMALESYRSVKHYFNEKGIFEDASWAAYRELTMERKYYFRSKNLRYIPSLLMDLLSGYTEKPNRVIVSSLGIVLLFGLFYYLAGAVRPTIDTHVALGFWDNVYFSFMTFTTVGFGDFVPKPLLWVRILVCIEAFSGPFMAGLYIFTLTRRYATN